MGVVGSRGHFHRFVLRHVSGTLIAGLRDGECFAESFFSVAEHYLSHTALDVFVHVKVDVHGAIVGLAHGYPLGIGRGCEVHVGRNIIAQGAFAVAHRLLVRCHDDGVGIVGQFHLCVGRLAIQHGCQCQSTETDVFCYFHFEK